MKTELKEDEKRLVDVLLSLQKHAFESVKNRQAMEWRLSISLWTVSVLLLGFLLKGDIANLNTLVKFGLTIIAAAAFVSHVGWAKGAGKRTGADINVTYFWEGKTRELLGVKYPDQLQKELDVLREASGHLRTYSFSFQLLTTLFLALGIVCVVWCR
jgi:hypothetical protein